MHAEDLIAMDTRSFLDTLDEHGREPVRFYSLPRLADQAGVALNRLPVSLKILLEALVRGLGRHPSFTAGAVRDLAAWTPDGAAEAEVPFLPARVLLQDFTGVPCVADLAALRSALQRAGREPGAVEPLIPVDLVIDHSVQLDAAGRPDALEANLLKEYERNRERYTFLRWGQTAFGRLRVLPPGLGICHQVNMEYLATVVRTGREPDGSLLAYPDTLVGTDSHTVMINSLGVLGWGVGGIEAEAAMLGQPIPIVTPKVTGVRLTGRLRAPATATDLALALTDLLRRAGVVGHFVEFFGPALAHLGLADRAPVANMAPEYGATMGFFAVDAATLAYLRETGRSEDHVRLVEAYCRAQGLWRDPDAPAPRCTATLEFDLDSVVAGVAGPRRPQDRLALAAVAPAFREALAQPADRKGYGVAADEAARAAAAAAEDPPALDHGAVAIASITSCTNTSNPALLLTAGLLARRAVQRGLRVPPHVKTSFAPGSRVATAFLKRAGLLAGLEALGFHVAAYGCATCIGNSGPLDPATAQAIKDRRLIVAAVLSGNRNFEGRIHPLTRANYLASPPLVVAYALAGTVLRDLAREPLGKDRDGRAVRLADLWPSDAELAAALRAALDPADYARVYGDLAGLSPEWNALPEGGAAVFGWDPTSTYIREPPFVRDLAPDAPGFGAVRNAAVLGFFGDFITTDHISPAGSLAADSPAARYLRDRGVAPKDFNSYGARRGNHEVMVRGTFANLRLRNLLVEREGGWTLHLPDGVPMSFFDAAERYRAEGVPLVILAGKMYGAGSSRDWAAKGPALLGVRAVVAESFERIHRSNLVEMGILPLEFPAGVTAAGLGLTGRERITLEGLDAGLTPGMAVAVRADGPDNRRIEFAARARIDAPIEAEYLRHGGILPYVLRTVLRA